MTAYRSERTFRAISGGFVLHDHLHGGFAAYEIPRGSYNREPLIYSLFRGNRKKLHEKYECPVKRSRILPLFA